MHFYEDRRFFKVSLEWLETPKLMFQLTTIERTGLRTAQASLDSSYEPSALRV